MSIADGIALNEGNETFVSENIAEPFHQVEYSGRASLDYAKAIEDLSKSNLSIRKHRARMLEQRFPYSLTKFFEKCFLQVSRIFTYFV